MGRSVRELRRSMTRREFYSWVAFARMYPLVEQEPPDFGANQEVTPDMLRQLKERKAKRHGL
jgi:hypothetical protein